MRLVDLLHQRGLSNRQIQDALTWGKIWVRGCPTALAAREVDPAEVEFRPHAPRHRVGAEPGLLLAGAGFVVVSKPAGALSVGAEGRGRTPIVLDWVEKRFGAAHVVHRLDELTSGLLIVATDSATRISLKEQLARRDIERRYLAIVRGRFPERLEVRSTLVLDRGDGRRGSGPGGVEAITRFRRLEPLRGATLIEARLETGRRHQVRIHVAEQGHPVIGDRLYGGRKESMKSHGRPRIALHAWRLSFRRPDTGELVRVEALLADDLESLRRRLGGGSRWAPPSEWNPVERGRSLKAGP